jgi:hypothetical protein
MSITRFFVDALGGALELGIATPEDLLRHATPDVLAQHLPRPLWSKLIAACLAAPRTDAKLVVDTIGVRDLCEHVPKPILWTCLAEIAQRALGRGALAMPPAPEKVAAGTSPGTMMPSPPSGAAVPVPLVSQPASGPTPIPTSAPIAVGPSPSQPYATHVPHRAATEPPAPLGELPPVGSRAPTARPGAPAPVTARTTTGTMPAVVSTSSPTPSPSNGLRATSAGASTRRPQAAAAPAVATTDTGRDRKGPRTAPPSSKRSMTTNADFDLDTDVSAEWKAKQAEPMVVAEVVGDDDLVDWAQAEETATGGIDLERKR